MNLFPEESKDMEKSLARDTVGTTLTNVALFLLGILIWIATARFLQPTWRGALALIMIMPAIVMRAGTLGFDQGIVVIGSSDRGKLAPLLRSSVLFGFIMGLLAIAILLGFMWGFPKIFWKVTQVWLPGPFLVISLAFPLHLMTMAYDAAIYAEDRIAERNLKELWVNAVMLFIIVASFFAFKLQLYGVIGAYIVANALSLVYGWLLVRNRLDLAGGISIPLLKDAIKIGFPVYLAQLASFIMLPIMMVILSAVLPGDAHENLARIAFFTMGYQMIERVLPVTRSTAFALLPKITTGSEETAGKLAAKVSRHTLIASLILFSLLILLVHPIVIILLGRRYLPVAGSFCLMSPGGVALSVASVWSSHLLARHRSLEVAKGGVGGVITALLVTALGFSTLPEGREVFTASLAVMLGSLVNAAFLFFAFRNATGLTACEILLPAIDDVKEWHRIPSLVKAHIFRRRVNKEEVKLIR